MHVGLSGLMRGEDNLHRLLRIGARDETPVRIVSSSLVLVRGLLTRGDYVTIMSRHQMQVESAYSTRSCSS